MQQAPTAHSQIGHHPFMQPPRMQQAAPPTGSAQQTHTRTHARTHTHSLSPKSSSSSLAPQFLVRKA
jgi:hypothetical protein